MPTYRLDLPPGWEEALGTSGKELVDGIEALLRRLPPKTTKAATDQVLADLELRKAKLELTNQSVKHIDVLIKELAALPELPPTPLDELRKIRDPQLRKDALRVRREVDEARAKEVVSAEAE